MCASSSAASLGQTLPKTLMPIWGTGLRVSETMHERAPQPHQARDS
jgi:hypothetical protein